MDKPELTLLIQRLRSLAAEFQALNPDDVPGYEQLRLRAEKALTAPPVQFLKLEGMPSVTWAEVLESDPDGWNAEDLNQWPDGFNGWNLFCLIVATYDPYVMEIPGGPIRSAHACSAFASLLELDLAGHYDGQEVGRGPCEAENAAGPRLKVCTEPGQEHYRLDGKIVTLTPDRAKLLAELVKQDGATITAARLTELTKISRPDKLIRELGPILQFIKACRGRGHGYRLTLD